MSNIQNENQLVFKGVVYGKRKSKSIIKGIGLTLGWSDKKFRGDFKEDGTLDVLNESRIPIRIELNKEVDGKVWKRGRRVAIIVVPLDGPTIPRKRGRS